MSFTGEPRMGAGFVKAQIGRQVECREQGRDLTDRVETTPTKTYRESQEFWGVVLGISNRRWKKQKK